MDTAIDSAALPTEPTATETAAVVAIEVEETSVVVIEAVTKAEATAEATDEAVAKETEAPPPTLNKRVSSKRLSAKARAAMEAAKKEEEQALMIASIDHSYLSFLNKRLRSNKKKLEKIKSLETARSEEGKILNEQQLELVGTKAVLEKLIAEMDGLREQFIEVYLQEEASKKELAEKLAAAEAAAAKAAAIAAAAISSTPAVVETKVVEELVVVVETKAEVEAEVPVEAALATDSKPEEKPLNAFEHVEDLLKTLHVVNLYNALGKEIPMVLDFFAKVLLGNTRPPAELSYEENLAESLEEARKYLLRSDKIVACETSYRDLRDLVEHLTKKQEQQIHDAAVAAAAAAGQSEVVAPQAQDLPHINFFTESQLESTDSNESVNGDDDEEDVDITDDKESLHAAGPEEIELPVEEPEAADNQSSEAPKSNHEEGRPKSKRVPSGRKSAWNRSKSRTASPDANSDDQQQPRRRTSGTRWKQQPNSNNSNNNNGTDGTAKSAPGSKPRRPRVQRNPNDENTGSFNANRSKDERQPRSERTQYQPRQRSEKAAPRA